MTALPWLRLYSKFATDPIVQALAFEDQRHFIVILCLKCDGVLDRKMPHVIREKIILNTLGLNESAAAEAKRRLLQVRFIDENWQPISWNKLQFQSDKSTERVRKYRKNKETGNVTETFRNSFRNGPDTDTDTEIRVSTNVDTGASKSKRFIKPSLSEVEAYCHQRNNLIDPEAWFDHYEANGWKVGRNSMKDWKATVRTWEHSRPMRASPRKSLSAVERVERANGFHAHGETFNGN